MSTDFNLLGKSLIRLGILVFLFIITPITITMAFKALDKFTAAPEIYFAYALIIAAIVALIFTIFYAFKTFSILKNAIFGSK
ncbi:DUF6095 family protein [uncultured Polaribacter sp.]|uniref:DUF6095 family protein n=1 Tax=uncultured Polaribacter sp. TaxID=174711 RepID=UPI002747C50D|nr:DUF6095 family protein [Polaribacter sp.]|tara:strand:- start:1142 stop:1387 length:246 start_codon:yes stop_codon:yes gene_type:complete